MIFEMINQNFSNLKLEQRSHTIHHHLKLFVTLAHNYKNITNQYGFLSGYSTKKTKTKQKCLNRMTLYNSLYLFYKNIDRQSKIVLNNLLFL